MSSSFGKAKANGAVCEWCCHIYVSNVILEEFLCLYYEWFGRASRLTKIGCWTLVFYCVIAQLSQMS